MCMHGKSQAEFFFCARLFFVALTAFSRRLSQIFFCFWAVEKEARNNCTREGANEIRLLLRSIIRCSTFSLQSTRKSLGNRYSSHRIASRLVKSDKLFMILICRATRNAMRCQMRIYCAIVGSDTNIENTFSSRCKKDSKFIKC